MKLQKEEIYFIVFLVVAIATMIAGFVTASVIAVLFTSLILLSAVMVYKLSYVIDTFIFKHTNLIQVFDGYQLSGDRNSAIQKMGERVIATTAAALHVNERGDIDKSKIENIISHLNFPFKFVMQVERLNMEKMLDKMQTTRNMREIALSRLEASNKSIATSNQIKREIERLEHDIRSISSGDVPLKLVYYIMTSATAESGFAAEEMAKSQIREISGQFDALLKSRSKILSGNDLIEVLKIDSSMAIS